MNLLLDKGIIPIDELKSHIKDFNVTNTLHFITEKKKVSEYHLDKFPHLHLYDDLQMNSQELEYDVDFSKALAYILEDSRTLMLLERVTRTYFTNESLFNKSIVLSNYVYHSLKLLKKWSIEILMFQATPHHINSWVLAKVAEFLKLPVMMIQNSPIAGRHWFVSGLDQQKPLPLILQHYDKDKVAVASLFIERIKGTYDQAIPSYEKDRLKVRKGKFWSWKVELKACFADPRKLMVLGKKRKLFDRYTKLSKTTQIPKKFIVLFLHYQPERTSLPEGYHYYQQLYMVQEVAMSLPEGFQLLVKEHPSSFTGVYDPRYRNQEFYNALADLKNVELVPLHVNSFNLIDSSHGIVTLTGTVGVESLIRGKAVYTFGVASYRPLSNVYNIGFHDLKMSLKKMIDSDPTAVRNELREDLLKIFDLTVGSSLAEYDPHSKEARLDANKCLLKLFFENKVQLPIYGL